MLTELCSILSHFDQSQFKQIFIFFSCSISTKCLFSSDKASLSQTLLLSCTSIITENCTVCSIFANWANAKLCKLFTKKEQNQTSKWVCAAHSGSRVATASILVKEPAWLIQPRATWRDHLCLAPVSIRRGAPRSTLQNPNQMFPAYELVGRFEEVNILQFD